MASLNRSINGKKRDAIVLGYTSDPQPDHRGQAVRENGPDMSRCARSEKRSQTVRCCPTSGIDVGMPKVCRLGSRGCSNHEPHDVETQDSSSSCVPTCVLPCNCSNTLRGAATADVEHITTILSWTISKLKPASRYLFHIPANSEFLRSRDRAQRKRSRSSQQPGSGKQLNSTQLLNLRGKIAVGDQL